MNELKTIILYNSFSKLKKMATNLFNIQFYVAKQTDENNIIHIKNGNIDGINDIDDIDSVNDCDDWCDISLSSSFYLIDLISDNT